MTNELVKIRQQLEDLMQDIKEDEERLLTLEEMEESMDRLWEKAKYINTWAFNSMNSGKLPWAIARLIKADCTQNDVNMETWLNINTIILNADILLKGAE